MEKLDWGRAAPVCFEPCLDSTNRRLKELAAGGAPDGTVLIAGRQTGGRGRLGRSFASPEGGLYLSVLRRPGCPPERTATLPAIAGLAVCRAVRELSGAEPGLKWPNDVILNGRKLCGILLESVAGPEGLRIVAGIGVNVNLRREDFPEELRDTACSLLTETGRETEILLLARRLTEELDGLYAAWLNGEKAWLEEYRRLCLSPGREILVIRGEERRPAWALSLGEDGALLVRYRDGSLEALRSGEVSVRGLMGYV